VFFSRCVCVRDGDCCSNVDSFVKIDWCAKSCGFLVCALGTGIAVEVLVCKVLLLFLDKHKYLFKLVCKASGIIVFDFSLVCVCVGDGDRCGGVVVLLLVLVLVVCCCWCVKGCCCFLTNIK